MWEGFEACLMGFEAFLKDRVQWQLYYVGNRFYFSFLRFHIFCWRSNNTINLRNFVQIFFLSLIYLKNDSVLLHNFGKLFNNIERRTLRTSEFNSIVIIFWSYAVNNI